MSIPIPADIFAIVRETIDDETLARTSRSIGDLASAHVARAALDAAWPLLVAEVANHIADAIAKSSKGECYSPDWCESAEMAIRVARSYAEVQP